MSDRDALPAFPLKREARAKLPAQAAALGDDEAELRATIEKFRAEEVEHRDTALASGAEQAPAYEALSTVIKAGSKLAIWLSTRI